MTAGESVHEQPVHSGSARRVLWIAALVVVALAARRAWPVWGAHLQHGRDLVYETPTLRTIELVRAGENPYDPRVYASGRMWFTMYTPLYAYAVAPLQGLASNPFLAGRAVSLAAALASAAALFLVRGRSAPIAWMLAGALFLVRPLLSNSAFVKPDMLATCASVLAVIAAERARDSRRWLAPCALLCVAAFATKQSFVAASAASLAFVALNDRRRGLELAAYLALGFGAFLAYAALAWGGGFWFCVFRAPQNPLQWSEFATHWGKMLPQPVAMLLLAAGIAALGVGWARMRLALLSSSPYPLYVLASAGVLLLMLPKVGAATNYFIEWLFASCLLLAHGLCAPDLARRGALRAAALCLPAVAAALAEVALASEAQYAFTSYAGSPESMATARAAASEIERQSGPHPTLLNLHYAGLSHPLPGELCISDPFLYSLLWEAGKLDVTPVVEALAARAYDGVIVSAELVDTPELRRASPLARALLENYDDRRRFPEFDYLVRQ